MSDSVTKIKEAADIVELISDFVPLKRSGANYLGLCPFHNDGKPSMTVSPSKQIFKCFSCGAGGDVFKFWSEYHQKTFAETLQELAQRYGIELELSPEAKARSQEFNLKVRLHEAAADYYKQKLLASKDAEHCRNYLKGRGITTETIEKFRLGYSPTEKNDWSKLIKHLKENFQVSEKQILEAGLASVSTKNPDEPKYFDKFRGRLMIPIADERGRAIAFGARALKDPITGEEAMPKYLNSADTDIYHKGEHLYGLNLAKESIRKKDAAIVVEGYFDAISLWQAGISNVVANQGTALTNKQARLLSKYSDSKRIYLCFDTDAAGETASERAFNTIMEASKGLDTELRIIHPEEAKDPDELIREKGVAAFEELISEAPLLVDFQIKKVLSRTNLQDPVEKRRAVKEICQYIAKIDNKLEQASYLKKLAHEMDLETEIDLLRGELKQQQGSSNPYQELQQSRPRQSRTSFGAKIFTPPALVAAEKELLLVCLQNRKLLEEFLAEGYSLISERNQKILEALIDISFENPELNDIDEKFRLLQSRLVDNSDFSTELSDLGMELEIDINKAPAAERFSDIVRRLNREKLNLRMKEITKLIKEVENDTSSEANQKWADLERERLEINKQLQRC